MQRTVCIILALPYPNYGKRGDHMNKRKKIPIGIEDFKTLIERNCYYVDKMLMIRDILDSSAMVNLFTRPRRFGNSYAAQLL